MSIITEIVTLKSTEGISKENFIEIVDGLEKNYHSLQPGFLSAELLYDDKTEEWIMLQHWDTMDHLKAASAKIFKDSSAEAFVKAVIPTSVKMRLLPLIKAW